MSFDNLIAWTVPPSGADKRESGANPERSGHCKRGAGRRRHCGDTRRRGPAESRKSGNLLSVQKDRCLPQKVACLFAAVWFDCAHGDEQSRFPPESGIFLSTAQKRRIIMKKLVPLTLALALGLTACGTAGQNPAPAASPTPAGDVQGTETPANTEGFPFTLTTKDGAEVTFTHVPEKVIAANGNAGDQLMALGLGDKIIATAYTNSDINPKWDAEYKAIPEAAETYISLETVLSLEPDFVYGRSSSFTEKYNTEHDTLTKYGIMSLSSIEGYTVGADVDVVYQDFYNLGRIFQVEDKAEEIVSGMKGKITAAEEAVAGQEATPVFVFDMAQEEGAYTCGNNFTSKLIEHAGGVNIFNDLDTTWATVSWETVVERAPEVIVINDYGDTTLEEKIAQLKENPALATVPAIQNDRIISVKLCEVFASSMTGDTVEKFARAFHPDCFA